ncbi:MAG: nicotinate-nucleotide adenylyltransferase [Hyphomicrobiales bacterium]|nr:nicotinate-nucleotide adenylyltransferase [Hyphomicrobiales bacterium]
MTARLPPHYPGMRIGLFGGTFNPPHAGHVLVSEIAIRRLKLDRVWWLVTPGNPLKRNAGLPPLEERIAAARKLTRDPRIVVTGLEAQIGTRFTYDTIAYLTRRARGVRFVWLMGADNLAQFSRWQRWTDIAALAPVAVVDRPGATRAALASKAAQRFAGSRIPEADAPLLPSLAPPAIVFLHDRRLDLSSTILRADAKAHAR